MLQTACPTSQQLGAIGAGRVSGPELESFEQHLESCPSCQTALDGLATGHDTLIDELRHAATPDPFSQESACHDVIARVQALVTSQEPTKDATHADTVSPTPAANTPPSFMLGKYEMLEEIGHGGMGTVYRARHTVLKKIVAVKVLPADKLKNAQAVARFRREIEAAGRLEHPHIVRASDADHADGQHFLVMEWLPGQDLAKLVRDQGPLPIDQAADYIRQAALGLDYAHQHGLVHRDVKPSNLYLILGPIGEPSPVRGRVTTRHDVTRPLTGLGSPIVPPLADTAVVKVLDLGLALLRDDAVAHSDVTSSGQIMGTYDYIAPEQTLEAHTVDARADIYSLGCTFYFLLTGRPPFAGKNEMQKLMAHQTETPPPLATTRPEVPAELAALVAKMLAKDPAQRPQTMSEVAAAVKGLQENTDVTASVSLAGSQAKPTTGTVVVTKARPRRLVAAALVLAVLGVAAIFFAPTVYRFATNQGELIIEIDDPGIEVKVVQNGVLVQDKTSKREFTLTAGKGEIEVLEKDGIKLTTKQFELTRGGKTTVKVTFQELAEARKAKDPKPGVKKEPHHKVDAVWLKHVATLSPEKQVDAVAAMLKERNPRFDGEVTSKIEDGAVTELHFLTDRVTDISPLSALVGLRTLSCRGSHVEGRSRGMLSDLSPIKHLKLTSLDCYATQVDDLSPLRDMKLTYLDCYGTQVSDLSPLKGMKLKELNCHGTKVADLTPLKDMQLAKLICGETPVSDLTPLKDMQLVELECACPRLSDLSPLKDMKLKSLECSNSQVSELSPLKDMRLTSLGCNGTKVSDLTPLKDMNLRSLHFSHTKVSDLTPLKAMGLVDLGCDNTNVSDLSPIKDALLQGIRCDFRLERDAKILRPIRTLLFINGKPVGQFWKEVDAKTVDEKPAPWPDLKAPVVLEITTKLGEKARVKVKNAKHPNVTLDYIFKLSPPACLKLTLELDNGVNLCIPLNVVKEVASKKKEQVVTLIDGTTYAGTIKTTVEGEDGKTHELSSVSALAVVGAKDAKPPAAKQALLKLSVPKPLDRTFAVYAPLIGVESGVKYGESFKITVDGEGMQGNLSAFPRLTMAPRDAKMKWNLTVQLPAGPVKTGALHMPHDWWYVQAEMPNGCVLVLNNHDKSVGFTIEKQAPAKKPPQEAPVGEIRAYLGHAGPVSCVAFAPDGKSFLSGGDAEILQWDVASPKEKQRFADPTKPLKNHIRRIAFSKDGKRAVSGGDDQIVRLWDVGKAEVMKYVDAPKANPPAAHFVAISPDDKYLLVTPAPSFVRLYVFPSLEESADRFSGTQGHFSKDGNKLLTLDRNMLELYHLAPLKRSFVSVKDISHCALTPDGRYAVAGGLDSLVYVWDMVEKKQVHKMAGHKGTIQALAVSSDGKRALSGGGDNMMRLWDLTTGKELREFEGHTAPVVGVAFSPDGRQALSAGGTDKSVRLWQLPEP